MKGGPVPHSQLAIPGKKEHSMSRTQGKVEAQHVSGPVLAAHPVPKQRHFILFFVTDFQFPMPDASVDLVLPTKLDVFDSFSRVCRYARAIQPTLLLLLACSYAHDSRKLIN